MKNLTLFILCFAIFSSYTYAGEYEGLIPGVSTLDDANAVLGKPVKAYPGGLRYDYSPDSHDLGRLSVVLDKDGKTISRIHLLFKNAYAPAQIKEWFELDVEPDSSEHVKGKLVELYLDQGIKIVHQSADAESMIIQLSHIDPDQPEAPKAAAKKTVKKKDFEPDPKKAEKFAKQADPFIENDDYSGAIPYLEKAAYYAPNRVVYSSMLAYAYFKINNLDDAISTAKKVVAKNEDYVAYSVLGTAYFRKKDYEAAIPYLEKAVCFKQDATKIDNLHFLGICYYEQGQLEQALDVFVKAYKKNRKSPISVYFLGVVSDRLGNNPDAKFYYRKYLRLRHNNSEMNKIARQRLAVVSKKTGKKNKNSFFKAVDMIQKEMKGF